jgi:hypothetical protein
MIRKRRKNKKQSQVDELKGIYLMMEKMRNTFLQ